jgi:predicted membrane protein
MFLSILLGYCIFRFVRVRLAAFASGILIGTLIGGLGALGVFGVGYPFFMAVRDDTIHIPEILPMTVFFLTSQFSIYEFSLLMGSSPYTNAIVTSIFVASSLVGIAIGYIIQRMLREKWHSHETASIFVNDK